MCEVPSCPVSICIECGRERKERVLRGGGGEEITDMVVTADSWRSQAKCTVDTCMTGRFLHGHSAVAKTLSM